MPGRDGKPVAPFTFGAEVVPAGAYAADSVLAVLRALRYFGVDVHDLIADRGYTALVAECFARPVREFGVSIVMDMVETQRKRQPDFVAIRNKGKANEREVRAKAIAGSFFTSGMPDELDDLARPGHNADAEERAKSMAEFDKRAVFAFVRHGPTGAGSPRWAGPATRQAGYKVRCENNDLSMGSKGPPGMPETRLLTTCVKGVPCSCGEYITVSDAATNVRTRTTSGARQHGQSPTTAAPP